MFDLTPQRFERKDYFLVWFILLISANTTQQNKSNIKRDDINLFSALNDCVYRSRGSSKYLVLVDLDEMIVPRKSTNYTALLDKLDTLSNRKKIGAYSFQNAFFYLQWPDDTSIFKIEGNPLAERVSKKLLSLTKTRRRSRLHPHKQRYVCKEGNFLDRNSIVESLNDLVY